MTTMTPNVTSASHKTEPMLALPSRTLFATVGGVSLLCGIGWAAVSLVLGQTTETVTSGVIGAAITAAVSLLAVLVMTPWKTRPMTAWMTMWLGGTVLRLLVTPALTWLVYSAASLSAKPLALSVAVTYVLTLLSEAAVLSAYVKKRLDS